LFCDRQVTNFFSERFDKLGVHLKPQNAAAG
jgi:hypothetical protein